MKMKRFLTLLLAVMLITALLAGCAKAPAGFYTWIFKFQFSAPLDNAL